VGGWHGWSVRPLLSSASPGFSSSPADSVSGSHLGHDPDWISKSLEGSLPSSSKWQCFLHRLSEAWVPNPSRPHHSPSKNLNLWFSDCDRTSDRGKMMRFILQTQRSLTCRIHLQGGRPPKLFLHWSLLVDTDCGAYNVIFLSQESLKRRNDVDQVSHPGGLPLATLQGVYLGLLAHSPTTSL
jgi:hypothetical protein